MKHLFDRFMIGQESLRLELSTDKVNLPFTGEIYHKSSIDYPITVNKYTISNGGGSNSNISKSQQQQIPTILHSRSPRFSIEEVQEEEFDNTQQCEIPPAELITYDDLHEMSVQFTQQKKRAQRSKENQSGSPTNDGRQGGKLIMSESYSKTLRNFKQMNSTSNKQSRLSAYEGDSLNNNVSGSSIIHHMRAKSQNPSQADLKIQMNAIMPNRRAVRLLLASINDSGNSRIKSEPSYVFDGTSSKSKVLSESNSNSICAAAGTTADNSDGSNFFSPQLKIKRRVVILKQAQVPLILNKDSEQLKNAANQKNQKRPGSKANHTEGGNRSPKTEYRLKNPSKSNLETSDTNTEERTNYQPKKISRAFRESYLKSQQIQINSVLEELGNQLYQNQPQQVKQSTKEKQGMLLPSLVPPGTANNNNNNNKSNGFEVFSSIDEKEIQHPQSQQNSTKNRIRSHTSESDKYCHNSFTSSFFKHAKPSPKKIMFKF